MSADRFSLFPCSFVHAGGTLDLLQMQGFAANPQAQVSRRYVGGAVDPKAHLLASGKPQVSFGTRDLATLLGTVNPLLGLASAAGGSTFRLQERDEGQGVFLTTATHETLSLAKSHLLVNSLSARQDDAEGAIAQCVAHALYDGTNEPILHATGADFSLLTPPAFTSEFFMGPVYHNGVQVAGVTEHSVEFGTQFMPFATDGDIWPRKGYVARRAPVIKFSTLKVGQVAALSKSLRALSGTLAIYFWKAVDNAARVAVGSSLHVKVSCATGAWRDDAITVSENDDGTVAIEVLPKGSLTISAVSTIP
ncbi:MAG: hypothetical protein M3Q42_11800 [Pseudomonadota bacterium]|nr:hypothetical protein [Pseudomonadota bacterium]